MSQAAIVLTDARNPPVDYAVAVWLGTPKDEIEKGLREGWIRRPGVGLQPWTEERDGVAIVSPPAPDDGNSANSGEVRASDGVRARIESLVRRLDASLGVSTFDGAWSEAGADEAARAARFVDFLGRAFAIRQEAGSEGSSRLSAVEQAAEGMRTSARFIRLNGLTGRELEQLAVSEGGVRRALAEHSPWAFIGDRALARRGDVAGRYDRFDPDSGELNLSDAWLGDRAKHAAWRNGAATGRPLEVSGDGWRFVDRAAGDAASVELRGDVDLPVNQVIFARDDGDRVNGSVATDRIHGGRGDDILRGRGGDDLLEGDAGDDVLQGGSGKDLIAGQQGDDELDGGAGADRLEGGGGVDELIGGRGDDWLRGGAGLDTYRFERGDGIDTIEDDGGVVVVDDVTIGGTMDRSEDGWASSDGRFRFTLEDAGTERRTLVIRAIAEAGNGAGDATVRIADWTPGSFGIALADGDETDESEASQEDRAANGNAGERAGGTPNQDSDAADAASEGSVDSFAESSSPASDSGGREGEDAAAIGDTAASNSLDASWLSADAFEDLALVDTQSVAQALDAWSPPAPPDVGSAGDRHVGITVADLGDAIAGTAQDADADSGATSTTLDVSFTALLPRFDGGAKSPPDPMLRTVS